MLCFQYRIMKYIFLNVIFLMIIILSACNFSKGKIINNGKIIKDKNGDTVKVLSVNKNGMLDGLYKSYDEGLIDTMCFYKNGVKGGEYKLFYKNGQLKEKGNYEENLKQGWVIQYFPDGKVRNAIEYIENTNKHREVVNQIIKYDSCGILDRDNSSFFKIGLMERYDKKNHYLKTRIQFYPPQKESNKTYAILWVYKNTKQLHKLTLNGDEYKRDFIIPLKNRIDSLRIKGLVEFFFLENANDTVYDETVHLFDLSLNDLWMFKNINPKELPVLPASYDTLKISPLN